MKLHPNNKRTETAIPKKDVILISVTPGQTKVEFTRRVMENFCKHGLVLSEPK